MAFYGKKGIPNGSLLSQCQVLTSWTKTSTRTWRLPASRVEPTHLKRLVDVSIVIHHLSLPWFTLGALEGRGALSQSLGQEGPESLQPMVAVPVAAWTQGGTEYPGLFAKVLKALWKKRAMCA